MKMERLQELLFTSLALIVASCGSPPMTACRPLGQACDVTTICCGTYVCTNAQCVAPASACHKLGDACSVGADCCTDSCVAGKCASTATCKMQGQTGCGSFGTNQCCSGLTCTSGTCVKPATCSTSGQFCTAANNTCCANLTCPRYETKCALGDIGDPCSTNAECLSGLFCNGWCTRACNSNAQCATLVDSPKGINDCIQTTTGGFLCFPFCSTTSECAIYGPGLTCSQGNDPNGLNPTVCG